MISSTQAVKYILFLLNLFCVFLGCWLLVFGVQLLNSAEDVIPLIRLDERLAATLTIVLGATILLVALFGCLGLAKEARGMLIGYAVILVALLIVQLVAIVSLSYAAANELVPEAIDSGYEALWEPEEDPANIPNNNDKSNNSLSYYEEKLECCGKNSPADYFLLDRTPPPSCCRDRDCAVILNLYVVGCEQRFREHLAARTSPFSTISWLLIVVELIGSVFACMLVDCLRNHRDRVRYYG